MARSCSRGHSGGWWGSRMLSGGGASVVTGHMPAVGASTEVAGYMLRWRLLSQQAFLNKCNAMTHALHLTAASRACAAAAAREAGQ